MTCKIFQHFERLIKSIIISIIQLNFKSEYLSQKENLIYSYERTLIIEKGRL